MVASSTRSQERSSQDWLQILAPYRTPSHTRSFLELIVTGGLFLALWAAAWWSLSISYWLTLAFCLPAGVFLTRLFLIQHDCGHGAFFRTKSLNDWVGRVLGVFTLTPYEVWRKSHAIHHGTSGNLDRRGTGDIDTLTVSEHAERSSLGQLAYRLYRSTFVMFGIGPAYVFFIRNRLPLGFMKSGSRLWISAMGTNIATALSIGLMIYLLGATPFLQIYIPTTLLAATIGIWLFFIQHQFEDTYWAHNEEWSLREAAFAGSSHFDLPQPFRWLTANIGIHHVHHLSARIPFYHLARVLRDFPELADIKRLTFWQSFSTLKLGLWDEDAKKLVRFPRRRG
ncbi:MAG: fatty acid desaturase [Parvibaculum sp.]